MPAFRLLYGEDILSIAGEFPVQGCRLPSFMLVDDQFNDVALAQFSGRPKALITLLSHDEDSHGGTRLLRETLRFLERWPMLQILAVSVDSPSTLRRIRKERGLPQLTLLSTLRGRDFHKHFGVLISEFPLAGYTAPAIIIADAENNVLYSERLRDTLDDFHTAQMLPALQAIEAAEVEAQARAAAEAARVQAEAEDRERLERAMVDTVKQNTQRI